MRDMLNEADLEKYAESCKPVFGPVDMEEGKSGLMLKGAEISEMGIRFPADYEFHRWMKDGVAIGKLSRSLMFYLGDWLNFGEKSYGEKYSQALSNTSYSYGTLRNASFCARRIPLEERKSGLSYAHHYEVCTLPKEVRDEILNMAEKEGWTSADVRNEVLNRRKERIGKKDDESIQIGDMSFELWWQIKKAEGWIPLNFEDACKTAWYEGRRSLTLGRGKKRTSMAGISKIIGAKTGDEQL